MYVIQLHLFGGYLKKPAKQYHLYHKSFLVFEEILIKRELFEQILFYEKKSSSVIIFLN